MRKDSSSEIPGISPWLLGCRGCCVCPAVKLFQEPLLEVNEQFLALAAGREQRLKRPFPRAFCPTAMLCQKGYFSVVDVISIFFKVHCFQQLW